MTNISKKLQQLVEHGTEKNPLPYKKGKTIFVGKCIVRKTKQGFLVFKEGKQIGLFNTLHGALASVKCITNDNSYFQVIHLDKMLSKYEEDIMFYKHGVENTKIEFKKENLEIRLSDSSYKKKIYLDRLENIIFN